MSYLEKKHFQTVDIALAFILHLSLLFLNVTPSNISLMDTGFLRPILIFGDFKI